MLKNKSYIVIIILFIMLSFSIFLNITYHSKNKRYENYLSEQIIANTLRPMGSSINDANSLLEEFIKNDSATYAQLQGMVEYYRTFAFGIQDLQYLYSQVSKENHLFYSTNPNHFRIFNELESINNDVYNRKETVHIFNKSELESLNKMQGVTKQYTDIFGTNYMHWDFSISSREWIKVLMELDKISRENF